MRNEFSLRWPLALLASLCSLALLASLCALAPPLARAQDAATPWAVIGTVPLFGAEDVERVALQLGADGVFSGAAMIAPAEAIRRFEASHSRTPESRSPSELAELERCVDDMALSLARGRISAAGGDLSRCESLLAGVRRTYDAQRDSEHRMFRECMALLEGMLATGTRERALQHAEMCRLHAVDLPLDPEWASAPLRELMSEVDASLASRERASLRVIGVPDGCDAWLRGHMIGRTPFVAHGLLAGAATLQLVCAGHAPGRVHHVSLVAGDNEVALDPALDTALRTARALVLDYGATWTESVRRLDDARAIGEAIGARVVVLVTMLPDRASLRVDRVDLGDTGARVVASVLVPAAGGVLRAEHVTALARALVEQRSVDLRGRAPRPIEPWSPPVAPRGPDGPRAE